MFTGTESSIYIENTEETVTMATGVVTAKTELDMDYAVFLNQSDTDQHLEDSAQTPVELGV